MADVPEAVINDSLKVLEIARNTGKISKGTNEAVKQIESGKAQLVFIAEDVQPKEVVAFIPGLCEEKKVSCIAVPNKQELGKAAGLDVSAASVAIVEAGSAKKDLAQVIEKLSHKGKSKSEEKPKAEEKPKSEEKTEEKKEDAKAEEKPEEKKE
ncbi:50S ribosomal protein L7Ae [Candidatus Undinarchaeota archaeon]